MSKCLYRLRLAEPLDRLHRVAVHAQRPVEVAVVQRPVAAENELVDVWDEGRDVGAPVRERRRAVRAAAAAWPAAVEPLND
jgi:hypothetical protein